jgi:hypothetical protein
MAGKPEPDKIRGGFVAALQCLTAVAALALCEARAGVAGAALQPGPADAAAAAEEILARPQVDFVHGLRDQEVSRLINDAAGEPSAYVKKLMAGDWPDQPALRDARVPLHLRLIELARLDLVSGVEAARQAVPQGPDCDVRNAFGRGLYEPQGRAAALGMIYCARAGGERALQALHAANVRHEQRIVELQLPPYTRERWLAEARAYTASQDERLQATYRHWRQVSDALEKWILFLDRHARSFHVVEGGLAFDSDSDAEAARSLQEEIGRLLDASPAAVPGPSP